MAKPFLDIELILKCEICGGTLNKTMQRFTPRIVHEDGTADHEASPIMRCTTCKGPIVFKQDSYADIFSCATCGSQRRYSLGD